MEGSLYHSTWAIQTKCYILWNVQLTSHFSGFMNNLFEDYIVEGWLVIYMDNLLIYSLDQELHDECTQKVLQCFQEQEMYLKLEKCTFSAKEVEYLGMIVGKRGIQMDPVKLKAI